MKYGLTVILILVVLGMGIYAWRTGVFTGSSDAQPSETLDVVAAQTAGTPPAPLPHDPAITSEPQKAAPEQSQNAQPEPQAAGVFWLKRCEQNQSHCEIFQRLLVGENKQRLVEMALGFQDKEKTIPRVALILPLGLNLPQGVVLHIEGTDEIRTPIQTCTESGCIALMTVSQEFVEAMKAGDSLSLKMQNATGRNVDMVLSLKGFSQAIAEL